MASCVLCTSLASVFCTQDRAFLCSGCDKTIHAANVISQSHKRLPVCELCKRSPASVYCNEDAACLCELCNREVHLSNPIPHSTVPIDTALASGLATTTACVPLAPQPPKPAAPEQDETSACGEHCLGGPFHMSEGTSEGNTSLAVVPEMTGPNHAAMALPSTSGCDKELKSLWGKDFDALDFEAAWLGNLDAGLDFSDILGNDHQLDEAPGMVPSIPAEEQAAAQRAKAAAASAVALDLSGVRSSDDVLEPLADEDFVVPSFLPEDFGDDLVAELHAPATHGIKREAPQLSKPSKRSKSTTLPVFHLAPPPPPLSGGSGDLYSSMSMVNEVQATRKTHESKPGPVLNGANLTREQRVARYREKRKNRKFQKTIRYASRKAYAEVRPRIKGRFATKEEVAAWKARRAAGIEHEDDHLMIFS